MSLRDQILAVRYQRHLEPIEVPEWGCTVYVPTMTVAEASDVNAIINDKVRFRRLPILLPA